jgi:methionyl-tRNA synthetase
MTNVPLTVITIPQPTANGPLHVGHLSGPYIAGDIAARAARARGQRVIVSTGLDIHQNYVLVRAQKEGADVEEMMTEFRSQITETYAKSAIAYDIFTDPMRGAHDATVADLVSALVSSGRVPLRDFDLKVCSSCDTTLLHCYVAGRCSWCRAGAAGGACEGCGGFTSAQDLIDPRCTKCGGTPKTVTTTLPVLRMEDFRAELTSMWLRAELPTRVRRLIGHHLAEGLPEIPVAMPMDWGIEGTGPLAGLRIDPYTEVALTDLYGIARGIDPAADSIADYQAAWAQADNFWQFCGLDNSFWYALYWPAVFAASGIQRLPLSGIVVNEFYTLDGSKFSTSRNHVIWANEFLAEQDPRIVRLYLAWDRPDRYMSDFTRESFESFRERVAPLLAAESNDEPVKDPLLASQLRRGLAALELPGFDAALAARGLLALLEAGETGTAPLRQALTGE